jgi:flagellar motility protein MotE (MotC chaperone)
MSPAGAGELLLQSDRSLAVEVMAKLDPRAAAAILSTLPASQAAEFADALTVRRPF